VWREGETNWIIDAHQRKRALVDLMAEGWKVPGMPVVFIQARDRKAAMRMILLAESRYAKITKRGAEAFIRDIDFDIIKDIVNVDEIADVIERAKADERAEVEFTEELQEEHNYVVLFFDTAVDWLQATTLLGLKQVRSLDAVRGNKGWARIGTGRVLRGAEAIKRIQEGARE
jgi:hypothetical protein